MMERKVDWLTNIPFLNTRTGFSLQIRNLDNPFGYPSFSIDTPG
jgi:hypothetical protein